MAYRREAAINPKDVTSVMKYDEAERLITITGYTMPYKELFKRSGYMRWDKERQQWYRWISKDDLLEYIKFLNEAFIVDTDPSKPFLWVLTPKNVPVQVRQTIKARTIGAMRVAPQQAGAVYINYARTQPGDKVMFIDDSQATSLDYPTNTIFTVADKSDNSKQMTLLYRTAAGMIRKGSQWAYYKVLKPAPRELLEKQLAEEQAKSPTTTAIKTAEKGKASFQQAVIVSSEDAERELREVIAGTRQIFQLTDAVKSKFCATLGKMNKIIAAYQEARNYKTLTTVDSRVAGIGGFNDRANAIMLNMDGIFKRANDLKEFDLMVRGVNWHEMAHYLFGIDNWNTPEAIGEGLRESINVLSDCRDESALVAYGGTIYIKTFLRLAVRRIVIRTVQEQGKFGKIGYALLYGRRVYYPMQAIVDARALMVEEKGEDYTKQMEEIVDGYLQCKGKDAVQQSIEWARKFKKLVDDDSAVNAASTNDGGAGGQDGGSEIGRVSKRIGEAQQKSAQEQGKEAEVTIEKLKAEVAEIESKIEFAKNLINEKGETEAATILAAMGW